MELRLNSPSGGDPAVYQWPLVTAVSLSSSIGQSSFITGMTERTPANTQQANTQQFINSSRVLVPCICLYTQLNEHLWTQVLKHLNVHIYLVTIAYRYYNQLISRTDLSPIPIRSAA